MKFYVFQISSDIEPMIQRKRDKMQELKLTVQPFVIVQGPSIEEIKAVYVSVDKLLFKVDNVLKGLDICFKSFHVLLAKYPLECEHLWLIVQHAVYQISTKWDNVIPRVTTILGSLKSIGNW